MQSIFLSIYVEDEKWYAEEAAKAKYYGLVEELQVRPNDNATKNELANMLDLILDTEEEKVKAKQVNFTDTANESENFNSKLKRFL